MALAFCVALAYKVSPRGLGENMPIRVLIADDSPVMRKAVRQLLMIEPEIEIVGEACSFRQMLEMKCQLTPDIVVVKNATEM
jgi:chemotaxis response regulator CheB